MSNELEEPASNEPEIACNGIVDDKHMFWRILEAAVAAFVLALGTGWLLGWLLGAQ